MKPSSSSKDGSVAAETESKAQTSSLSSPRRSSASSVDSLWQSSGYSSSSVADGTQNKVPSSSTDKPTNAKAKAPSRRKTKPGSHAKKKDADHVPRPRNAFILFRCHAVANNLIPPTFETDHRNISRIVSHMWNSLPEQDRAVWQGEAQKEKERHAILYPEYKYQPLYRKPATLKRNIPAPENTAEQCEKAADMILKMYGENNGLKVKGAEEGRLLSASARRKIERRELAEQRLALRKANPPSTGRKRTTSSNSAASKRPNTASSSQAGTSRSGVSRSSIASSTGASSVSSHLSDFGGHSSLHEGAQPSVLAGSHSMVGVRDGRRSSSVPPLEDNYRGFGQFAHHPGPHHPSDGHISSAWHANLSIDPDLARHGPALPLHGSPWGAQPLAASPMMDDMQTPRRSTMRKPPPPPLFSEDGNSAAFAPPSAYVPYTPGSSMHHVPPPSGIYEPPQWLQLRRRTIESATPRSTSFNIPPTPRAAQHRPLPGHLMSNDVALVSPLRSSFAEARRTSVAWHNWSRMSQLDSAGASPSASGARWRHSAAGDIIASAAVQEAYPASGGGLVTPTMFGMMMQQQQQHTPIASEEHHGIPNSAAAAQHRHASHDDVFTFGPDFIVDAQSDTDVRPGTSTAASEASPAAPASIDGSSGPPSLIDSARIQQGSFASSSDMMDLHEDHGQHSSSRMTDDEPREELIDDVAQQDVYMSGTEDSPLKDDRGRGKSHFAWGGQDGSLAADISNRLFSRWSQRPSTGGVNMCNGSSSSLPEDMPTLHRFNSLPPSYETASAPSSVDAHSSGYSSHQMTPSSTIVVMGEVHQEQESRQLQAHSPAYANDVSQQHIASEPAGMTTGYEGMPLNSTPMSSEETAREWQVYGTGERGRATVGRHSRLDATLVDALQQQLSPESSTGDSFVQDVISPLSDRFSGAAQHPRSFGAFVGSSSAPSSATMFSARDHLQHQQHEQQLQAAQYRQHQEEAMVHDTRFASASPTVNTNNLVTSPMGFQDEGYLYVNPSSTTGPVSVSSRPPSQTFPTSTHSTPSANRSSNRRRRGPIHSASSSAIPTSSTRKREKSPTATRGSGRFVQMSMVPLSAGPRRVEHFHEPKP